MGTTEEKLRRSDAAFHELGQRLYGSLLGLADAVERWAERGVDLRSFTVRPPKEDGGEWLVVARIRKEGEPMVGFTSGGDPAGALQTALNRMYNGSMDWRRDEYG